MKNLYLKMKFLVHHNRLKSLGIYARCSFILISFGFKPLPQNYRGFTKSELAKSLDTLKLKQFAGLKANPTSSNLKLIKLKQQLTRLKRINSFSPTFDEHRVAISTFSRFYGVIDGNIISSGPAITFKVNTDSIYQGSYLACTGANLASKNNYRLIASCDRLITSEHEYQVLINLKDLKKVEGLSADHVYTGDEEMIMGEGLSAIMSGIIDARKQRIATSIGPRVAPTFKNAYLSGLINAAKLTNSKGKEHNSNSLLVLAIKDKTKVIVEFQRRFTWLEL